MFVFVSVKLPYDALKLECYSLLHICVENLSEIINASMVAFNNNKSCQSGHADSKLCCVQFSVRHVVMI